MKRDVEIKGNQLIVCDMYGKHIFEIVDKVPSNYSVWNIGECMGTDEFIPFCRPCWSKHELNTIDPDSLKAIKLDPKDVMILRKAAHRGINSKRSAIACKRKKRQMYR